MPFPPNAGMVMVYPRPRGGTRSVTKPSIAIEGLSPPTRGNPLNLRGVRPREGSILQRLSIQKRREEEEHRQENRERHRKVSKKWRMCVGGRGRMCVCVGGRMCVGGSIV